MACQSVKMNRRFNDMPLEACEKFVVALGMVVENPRIIFELHGFPKTGEEIWMLLEAFDIFQKKGEWKVKYFTEIDRKEGCHKFYLTIYNKYGYSFDVIINSRIHKIGCVREYCNSFCVKKNHSIKPEEKQIAGEPDDFFPVLSERPEGEQEEKCEQETEIRNDVAWCVSHKDEHYYVKEITHVRTCKELVDAFNFFRQKYTKSKPKTKSAKSNSRIGSRARN
jgi:hypothetical protein